MQSVHHIWGNILECCQERKVSVQPPMTPVLLVRPWCTQRCGWPIRPRNGVLNNVLLGDVQGVAEITLDQKVKAHQGVLQADGTRHAGEGFAATAEEEPPPLAAALLCDFVCSTYEHL